MAESKAWDWSKVAESIWEEPSEDVYYYLYRWKTLGFSKLLDLGCGIGRHSILFAKNGFLVDAFDLSRSGLDRLNEIAITKGLPITTTLGDMRKLPYETGKFDCILAYHSIYHTDANGIKCVISEIARVLKPGGEIFVTFNSKNSLSFRNPNAKRVDDYTIIKLEGLEANIPHCYLESEDIRRLLKDFEILRLRQIEDIRESRRSWHYFVHAKKR